jgi:hypothetical protein
MDIKILSNIIIRGKKNIVFPLKNADGWIHDAQGSHLLDVRGWGHFQYADNDNETDEFGTKGAEIQDAFGDWVVKTLNAAYENS